MIRTILLLLFSLSLFQLNAQNEEYPYPSLSPKGKIFQVVGNTTIEIEYERPSARKRSIFGNLVPWNKVWRTGAGHCTTIEFSKNVRVEGQAIQAGKYALLTIPNPDEWIIILNSDTTLYGSYHYDRKKDVARFVTIPKTTNRYYETLNIDIDIIPNNANIHISWANTQVSFLIETTTDQEIQDLIENELVTGKSKQSDIYAGAAEYLFYNGRDFLTAIKLADKAIELDENNGWARNLKIKIYEKLKLYDDALIEVDAFLDYVQKREYEQEAQRENIFKELKATHIRIENLSKNNR